MAIGIPRILNLMPNVERLPPASTFSVPQALADAQSAPLADVVVVGWDEDGDLFIRSSRMSRADALWLLEKGKSWALDNG